MFAAIAVDWLAALQMPRSTLRQQVARYQRMVAGPVRPASIGGCQDGAAVERVCVPMLEDAKPSQATGSAAFVKCRPPSMLR
jgi:hypothetical protein